MMDNTASVRAAIYVRVSDPKQIENTSLASQEEACRGYVREQGWHLDEQHVYREVFSGAYLERPQFDRLRRAIDRRGVDRVVVWHTDGTQTASAATRRNGSTCAWRPSAGASPTCR